MACLFEVVERLLDHMASRQSSNAIRDPFLMILKLVVAKIPMEEELDDDEVSIQSIGLDLICNGYSCSQSH